MEDATNTSMACAMQKSTSLFFGLTVMRELPLTHTHRRTQTDTQTHSEAASFLQNAMEQSLHVALLSGQATTVKVRRRKGVCLGFATFKVSKDQLCYFV